MTDEAVLDLPWTPVARLTKDLKAAAKNIGKSLREMQA